MTAATPDPLRVLIAGGGIGALETALALRALAGAGVRIDLLAPDRHFAYPPASVAEPFRLGRTVRWELAELALDRGFGLIRDAVERVAPEAHQVITQGGAALDYDVLVLSLGARPRLTVPGAFCFRGPQDTLTLRHELLELQPGARVGYVVDGSSTWPAPAYELALMTEHWSRTERRGLDVVLVTSEPAPLAMFGASASERVERVLAERGIGLLTERSSDRFAGDVLHVAWDTPIPFDAAIALPALTGPALPGIPHDALGFAPVDEHGRVHRVSDVFAVGDMADHAIKQGGLAAQQGDVVAHAIAAQLHGTQPPPPPEPILRALLFTGEEPLWLRNPPGPPDPLHGYLSEPAAPAVAA
jgi:sulfide:quinone oxidoreductase